jgi:hypothetical protein
MRVRDQCCPFQVHLDPDTGGVQRAIVGAQVGYTGSIVARAGWYRFVINCTPNGTSANKERSPRR